MTLLPFVRADRPAARNRKSGTELPSIAAMTCVVFVACAALTVTSPAQTFTLLDTFAGANGALPFYQSLTPGPDGNFYGTTARGGTDNDGTIFQVTPKGALTNLYSFCPGSNCSTGAVPYGGLVLGSNGKFYGTTYENGANGGGTVFEFTLPNTLTTIYNFCSESDCVDGGSPESTLVQGKDGDFYGTTVYGGKEDAGTVFKITPSGSLTTLYSFCSKTNCTDGDFPGGGLVQASNGDFYGVTGEGGTGNYGTAYEISSAGAFKTVHSFKYTDGLYPEGGLVQASDGNLYGVAYGGGKTDNGTVFKMTEAGVLTVIYNFCSKTYCTDGNYPAATLIQGKNGDLYGTTNIGGADHVGTVFSLTTTGTLTTLHSFKGTDGQYPYSSLVQASNGTLYGLASYGGAKDDGIIFSLTLPAKSASAGTE